MKIEEMIAANRADCNGCEACANICPLNAIEMCRDEEGFAYPKINAEICNQCGKCDEICPALNFTKTFPAELPKAFVAINTDESARRHSSSGGAFSALSEIILRGGGIVFGAAFDKKFHVVHTCARNLDELKNLRGSKYVQSQIGDVYKQVKEALQSTSVLFSGTPCQCAGLKNFLGDEPENLLTVDIICHGVPSPEIWESYIGTLGYAHEVTDVNFGSKRLGWKISYLEINFSDQGHYMKQINKDPYGNAFLSGLSERPSCHSCKFKFPSVQSDLTLGDAFGVQYFAPEMFDDKGTSLVIVHTEKGKKFFEQTALKTQEVELIDLVLKNPRFITSSVADERRKKFFSEIAKYKHKLGLLQKYSEEEDVDARQKVSEQSQRSLMENYQAILNDYRKKFERNVLVVTPPLDEDAQKFLGEYFEKGFQNCGLFLLQPESKGKLICIEKLTSLVFTIKEDVTTLSEFAKQFNITEIYADNKVKYDSPTVVDWLNACGLPVNVFALSAN